MAWRLARFYTFRICPRESACAVCCPWSTRYPVDQYPDGQWHYYQFYLKHFDQTVTDFNVDIAAILAALCRSGDPRSVGDICRSALVSRNGRMVRFGASGADAGAGSGALAVC